MLNKFRRYRWGNTGFNKDTSSMFMDVCEWEMQFISAVALGDFLLRFSLRLTVNEAMREVFFCLWLFWLESSELKRCGDRAVLWLTSVVRGVGAGRGGQFLGLRISKWAQFRVKKTDEVCPLWLVYHCPPYLCQNWDKLLLKRNFLLKCFQSVSALETGNNLPVVSR